MVVRKKPNTVLIPAATSEQPILVKKAFLTFDFQRREKNSPGEIFKEYTSTEASGISTIRESINTTIPNVQRNPGITLAFFTLFCLTVFLIRKTPLLIVINLIKHGIIIKTFLICFLPAAKIVNRP